MKVFLNAVLFMLCFVLPLNGFAMKHGDMDGDDHKMSHESMDMDHGKMDHDSMKMGASEIPLGEVEVDGVKAKAYLLDVRKAMAKHGMKTSHHLMVRFTDAASGEALTKGRAAVKVREGKGDESKAHKMMRMDGAFGSDLTLAETGHYKFRVGTKLAGEKRTFEFEYGMMSHK